MADERATLEVLMETAQAVRDVDRLRKDFETAVDRMDAAAKEVDFDPASQSAKELQKEVERTARALNRATRGGERGIREFAKAANLSEKEVAELRRRSDELDASMGRFSKTGVSGLKQLKVAAAAAASAFAAIGVQRLIGGALDAALAVDRYRIVLRAVTDDQEEANREFAFARELAERLSLSVESTTENYSGFLASIRGTALEGEKGRQVFVDLSESLRALQASEQDVSGVMEAVNQIIGNQTVSLEDLRQITTRIRPLATAAAEAIREQGESYDDAQARLRKMISSGELLASDFLPKLAAEAKKALGQDLANALDSPAAKIQDIKNVIFDFQAALGSGFVEQIGDAAEEGAELLVRLEGAARFSGEALGFLAARAAETAGAIAEAGEKLGTAFGGGLEVQFDSAELSIRRLDTALLALSGNPGPEDLRVAASNLSLALTQLQTVGGYTADQQAEIEAKARQVALAFVEAGVKVPPAVAAMSSAVDGLREALEKAGEGGSDNLEKLSAAAEKVLSSLAEKERELTARSNALVEAFGRVKDSGSALQLDLLVDQAAALVTEFENAGQSAPAALEEIANSLNRVGDAARVLDDLGDREEALVARSEALVNAFGAVERSRSQIQMSILGAEVAALVRQFESLGVTAPAALQAIAQNLNDIRASEQILASLAERERELQEQSQGVIEAFDALAQSGSQIQFALLGDQAAALLAQFKALGVEAPVGLQSIVDLSDPATSRTGALADEAERAAGAFGRLTAAQAASARAPSGGSQSRFEELDRKALLTPEELEEYNALTDELADTHQRVADTAEEAGEQVTFYGAGSAAAKASVDALAASVRAADDALESQSVSATLGAERFEQANEAVKANIDSFEELAAKTGENVEAIDATGISLGRASPQIEDYGAAVDALREKVGDTTQDFNQFVGGQERATQQTREQTQATGEATSKIEEHKRALEELQEALDSIEAESLQKVRQELQDSLPILKEWVNELREGKKCIEEIAAAL